MRPGGTAAIAIKPGHRIQSTRHQGLAKNVEVRFFAVVIVGREHV
jgi:hypothetical protein